MAAKMSRRWSAVLVTALALLCRPASAQTVASHASEPRVTVQLDNVALPAALDSIAKAANLHMFYGQRFMPETRVTLHLRDVSVSDAFAAALRGTGLGVVISDKADKTITVRIDVARRHRRYEKIVRSSTTFHAHDERNDAHEGDTVIIRESRPLSRLKRWRLVEVVERAK